MDIPIIISGLAGRRTRPGAKTKDDVQARKTCFDEKRHFLSGKLLKSLIYLVYQNCSPHCPDGLQINRHNSQITPQLEWFFFRWCERKNTLEWSMQMAPR
ncbi:MAG: hypothetical protein QGF09_17640 [Rhodospirillales bacterium]|nr:hypothetical protein [Rhodospirillales bacterium]